MQLSAYLFGVLGGGFWKGKSRAISFMVVADRDILEYLSGDPAI